MIHIIALYIALIFICAIPIQKVLSWIFIQDSLEKKSTQLLSLSKPPILNIIGQGLTLCMGFLTIRISQNVLFYDDDALFIIGIVIALISFMWSVFNKFSCSNPLLPFILGIYLYFSPHIAWIFIISFLGSSLLFNSTSLGYIFSILTSFLVALSPIETQDLFIPVNILILTLFILRFNSQIRLRFSSNHTLFSSFKQRQ